MTLGTLILYIAVLCIAAYVAKLLCEWGGVPSPIIMALMILFGLAIFIVVFQALGFGNLSEINLGRIGNN